MSASSFNVIHSATGAKSICAKGPWITRGDWRIATTARLVPSILSPWVRQTLTRASWRERPRGVTHTVIGRPVSRGDRFAILYVSASVLAGRDLTTREAGRRFFSRSVVIGTSCSNAYQD